MEVHNYLVNHPTALIQQNRPLIRQPTSGRIVWTMYGKQRQILQNFDAVVPS